MNIDINTDPKYRVIVDKGIISSAGELSLSYIKQGCKLMLVSDSNVFPLYGKEVISSLKDSGFKVSEYIFDAGEHSKTLNTVEKMYEHMAENGFTRSDCIVALGGGVTGDMAGFAAATFLRGIKFIQIPTTLLAQVDSSVGGKTGVDLKYGKNLVGAFHQPSLVLADPETLLTLTNHFKNDGMGEVIKYACIDDIELFKTLEKGISISDMDDVIVKCIESKKHFVEEDTLDTGARMKLNFGHTFGHGVEKLQKFKGFAHGEAVAIGMLIAVKLGEKLGVTQHGTYQVLENMLLKYGLPTQSPFDFAELLPALALDKKSDGQEISLILLEKIGKSVIYKIDKKKLEELIK